MSARVTRRFDPSLLFRSENPMCLSEAKCDEWPFHSAHSYDDAQPLSETAAARAISVVTARTRMWNPSCRSPTRRPWPSVSQRGRPVPSRADPVRALGTSQTETLRLLLVYEIVLP